MKTMQKGFTLIELMIVVAIIAILAAIAIPQYQNYITKSQFTESQTVADGLKTPIVEYYNQAGNCPSITGNTGGLAQAVTSYAGKYVAQADVADATNGCEIKVTFKTGTGVSKPLSGAEVDFTGVNNGGVFTWTCSSTIASQYKPQACQ